MKRIITLILTVLVAVGTTAFASTNAAVPVMNGSKGEVVSDLANDKRMSVYAFFATRRGLDNIVEFSTTSIVRWLNKKPDNHKNGINKKIKQTIDRTVAENYIHVNSIPSTSTWFEGTFNLDKLTKECETERFAMIYLDEVEKIMNYNKISPKTPI